MRRSLPIALLLASAACAAPRTFSLRTQHVAALTVESRSPALLCELPPRHAYGGVQRVTQQRDGTFGEPDARELYAPLPVRLSNRGDEVVSVDWERAAFVDASGLSRRVLVYAPGAAADGSEPPPKPLERPAPTVIAPGSRAEALLLPERTPPVPAMFFLPPYAPERTPVRLVASATGTASRSVECVIAATLEETKVARNADVRWPGHGDPCVPGLGCAEGCACQAGVCVDPKAPPLPAGYRAPLPRKRLYGESCERDDDCVQGFRCDVRTSACVSG